MTQKYMGISRVKGTFYSRKAHVCGFFCSCLAHDFRGRQKDALDALKETL